MMEPTRDRPQPPAERPPSSSKETWDIIHSTPTTEEANLLRETQVELHLKKLQLRKAELRLTQAELELSQTKLHLSELRLQLSELELVLHEKEKAVQQKNSELVLAKAEIEQANKASIFQYLLTLISVLLFGFGVSLVTSTAVSIGWIMIVSAAIIQILSLYRNYGQKKKCR